MTKQKNPFEKELDKLDEQWEAFIDTELPIFHWVFAPDDGQLALTFFKVKEQLDEKNPHLFIHLSSEFESAENFGYRLADEMNQLIKEGLAEADDDASEDDNDIQWHKPDLENCRSGFQALFRSCNAAINAFGDYVHSVTLAVTPTAINSARQYVDWWAQCCDIHTKFTWPKLLRLIVLDTHEQSELARLAQKRSQHIHSAVAPVNMRAAMQAVLEQADDGSPGARLRQHMTDLQEAAGKQDRPTLESHAAAALQVAQDQRWLDMWAAVLLIRAAGYLNLQAFADALNDYRAAQSIAQQGEAESAAGCEKLFVQAQVCEGTCLFNMERFEEAAVVYARAAQAAEQRDDLFLSLDSWRMASFCMERNKDEKQAWDYAKQSLDISRRMDAQQRSQSTLPFLGQAMIRLSPSAEVRDQVKLTFSELLNEDWLEQVQQVAKAC